MIGLARTPIDRPAGPYAIHPEPVLRSERGTESPRVFRVGDEWHMFVLRYSTRERPGMRRYGHYRGADPIHWELVNDDAYVTTSDRPGVGAADMCPVWTPFEGRPASLGPWPTASTTAPTATPPLQAVAVGDPQVSTGVA